MYITTSELCRRYSISRTTAWRWRRAGRLPDPVQIGPGVQRWRLADLEDYDRLWAARGGAAA